MSPHNLYLVGSVPLNDARAVFETISGAFGNRIAQIPDGETGPRGDWITHLEALFRDHPDFEPSGEVFAVHGGAQARRRYQLKPGRDPNAVTFGNLGYADAALASYAVFRPLRDSGAIAPGTRFQVDLVPAHSVLWLFVAEKEQRALDRAYNAAVISELQRILAAIPNTDVSIQFDIASAVFARLERGEPTIFGATKAEMVEVFSDIVANLANQVPPDVPLLLHFCYGDANHKHAIEPTDMGDMTAMANALSRKINRTIDLLHLPVPRERDDAAYFEPLKQLAISPRTQLFLGLVHYSDGIAGAQRRIKTATQFVRDFGIATECGFGRRDPQTLPELLNIHVQAADADL